MGEIKTKIEEQIEDQKVILNNLRSQLDRANDCNDVQGQIDLAFKIGVVAKALQSLLKLKGGVS